MLTSWGIVAASFQRAYFQWCVEVHADPAASKSQTKQTHGSWG
jgi:hypothetical protein